MKIVKMHKGSREAFDDFLAQRLNEVEIDNDTADKYFADMNLPVPVIPATEISFLAKHKNKLWLLLLLCITSISTFLIVNNKNITQQKTTEVKKENYIENRIERRNKNNGVEESKLLSEDKGITKIDNQHELANNNAVVSKDKFDGTQVITKTKKKGSYILSNSKKVEPKTSKTKASYYFDRTTNLQKDAPILVDKKNTSILLPTTVTKSLNIDMKTVNRDSLYIIW